MIPEDKSSYGAFTQLRDDVSIKMKGMDRRHILKKLTLVIGTRSNSNQIPNRAGDDSKSGTAYTNCLNIESLFKYMQVLTVACVAIIYTETHLRTHLNQKGIILSPF